ncbi:hypothetical protein D3C76_1858350 [compost metagenome]
MLDPPLHRETLKLAAYPFYHLFPGQRRQQLCNWLFSIKLKTNLNRPRRFENGFFAP